MTQKNIFRSKYVYKMYIVRKVSIFSSTHVLYYTNVKSGLFQVTFNLLQEMQLSGTISIGLMVSVLLKSAFHLLNLCFGL